MAQSIKLNNDNFQLRIKMDIALKIALISLIGTVLGSGSITAIVNAIVSHKGKMAKQLTSIQTDVKNLEDKVDKNEAQRARTQILRFNDELYMGKIHTKEHFDEILAACDSYNKMQMLSLLP